MTTTLEDINQNLIELKKDLQYIKSILSENFELSDYAKKALKEARETPESEYTNL